MIIVDKALQERESNGTPIQVGLIGAGFMARGIAMQIANVVPGMRLAAVSNRHLAGAEKLCHQAKIDDPCSVQSASAINDAVGAGKTAITDDPLSICQAEKIDVILEVTGAVEFGALVAKTSIENGTHFCSMNAELDGTLGPILKIYADKAGVVYSNTDGDQPGVTMNLYRFVKGIGVRPVLCGNIKGLHDPYRNPTTQAGFAAKWGQKAHMVTSFADGSKISFEQAIIANGTGMRVGKRGMFGPTVPSGTPLDEVSSAYPLETLLEGPGIVDYVVGASPGPGVFVLGTHDDPIHQHYFNLYKLGEGPLYCFYRPYHLCHFEAHNTLARAVLFQDATLTPLGPPCVDVITTAKIDLAEGSVLDGIGHYMTYGLCENSDIVKRERLLPLGLAEGCKLRRSIRQDQAITYDDVVLPEGRVSDALRQEQDALFA